MDGEKNEKGKKSWPDSPQPEVTSDEVGAGVLLIPFCVSTKHLRYLFTEMVHGKSIETESGFVVAGAREVAGDW